MKYDHGGLAPHILNIGRKRINIGFTPCRFGPPISVTDDQSKLLLSSLRYVTIRTFVTETAKTVRNACTPLCDGRCGGAAARE